MEGDRRHRRLQGDHVPVSAVITDFAKGKRSLALEYVHSRSACRKPVIYWKKIQSTVTLFSS